ncbi:MAG: response regulator [Chitinophagaceae bacterium]|nr:MAG: response regulator [Chitinophagaceae bacterium]
MRTKFFHMIWLLAVLLFAAGPVSGQLSFHHLTVEDGLSQNAVIAIGQDAQGFMWFGTSNGLNRYDGYRFRVYQSRASDSTTLTGNSVLSILTDSRKTVWIGTYNGLNKYLPAQDRFQRIASPVKKNLTYHTLYEDKRGSIWVGTTEGLYQLVSGKTDSLRPVPLPAPGPSGIWSIRSIFEDRNGYLWIGTTEGLLRRNINIPGSSYEIFHAGGGDPGGLSADFITSIEEDRQGRVWVGTHLNGLNRFDIRTGKFTKVVQGPASIVHNNIRKILSDKEGRIWVGTQEGISVLDEQGQPLFRFQQDDSNAESLSQNSVHSLYQDASGNIWAGTYFGGVNCTYALTTQFSVLRKKDQPQFLNNNVISSITEDDKKNLWIGTEGGGLNYYDRTTGKFRSFKNNPNDPGSIGSNLVKVVYRDWQGQIWTGTHGGGLNLYDRETGSFRKFLYRENDAVLLNEEILSICEDSKGRLWVGSTLGIKLFSKTPQGLAPIENALTKKAPFASTATCFMEDDRKRMWIACSDGLYYLQDEQFHKVSGDLVNCLRLDSRSQVWAGIQQGGLARFNEQSQKLDYFNQPGKIGNRNILGILEDDQRNLWLSSDNGLLKYNPEQDQLQLFSVSDGLSGNAFNYNSYFRDSRGEFFFGGFNGLTHFFPEKIKSNQRAGTIVFTGLRIFNDPVEVGDSIALLEQSISATRELKLRHNQDVITIEFALLSFIKSNKNTYAYKLEGYDKDWVYTSTPLASYANLPSGSFTFLLKGANNDGVWTDTVQMEIEVLPPFWLTWWAYTLYVIIIGALVFFVLRYFILGALLKKEEELHQVKLNFFTNISHEIRTHLTLIMAPVERIFDSAETTPFYRQQLGAVKQNANRLLKLVSELMDFRKAETGNLKLQVTEQEIVPFLEDVYNSFRDVSIRKDIITSFIYDGGPLTLWFDREQLEKVFFNLLTNAIKFTPRHGRVWLQVTEQDKAVEITVTDNGRGIAPEYIDRIFTNFFQVADHGHQNTGYGIGLALARNIVNLHHGSLRAESEPAQGQGEGRTSFIVTLPKGREHFGPALTTTGKTTEHRVEGKPVASPAPQPAQEPGTDTVRVKPGILVVEDNVELRALIRDTFSNGYQVEVAPDGLRALEIAFDNIPDIIISDVMMPGMDGFDLCRVLKTDPRTSHIPVILLTARSTQSDQVSGLETGADMYLTKPFSTRILELNVRNLLAARERLRQVFLNQVTTYTPVAPDARPVLPAINPVEQEFLRNVISIVEEFIDDPGFGVEMLSRKVAMSTPVLYKKMKAVSNMSVNDFIKSIRLKRAAQLLSEKQMTVYEVAFSVGYNDRKYFSQEFKKQFGKTPTEYAQAS